MTRGRYSQRGRQSFKTRVSQVLNRKAETKYYDIGAEDYQLYHNVGTGTGAVPPGGVRSIPVLFNPWAYIEKGTERFQRIGDKITPRGMKVTMYLANKWDRPATMLRVIVAVLPKSRNGVITGSQFDPFQIPNSFALGNRMLMPADQDKGVKFLYDKVIRITDRLPAVNINGTKENTTVIKLWIRRKRSNNIIFDTSTQDIVNKPLAVYVIPYEQFSTLETSNVASVAAYTRLYYKDI